MVAPLALLSLTLATLFVAVLPIVLHWRLRAPMGLDRRDAIVGIAVFAFFAMVIERALNGYLLGVNETTAAWLSNPVAFVTYGALAAGVCEEVGRYIGMHFVMKRRRRTGALSASDGPALGYGLGHGGAEAWLVGVLTQAQWIVYAVLANRGQLDSAMTNVQPDALLRIHLLLASLSVPMAAIFALERTAALVFQIALSVLMWRGMRAGWRGILPLAIVVHALIDVPAALFQARVLPLIAVDGAYVLAALVLAGVLFKICRTAGHADASAAGKHL